jgi:hypothetical protein
MIRVRVFALLLPFLGALPARADTDYEMVVKIFQSAMKNPDWKERRDACIRFSDADRAESVGILLEALGREENPAVVLEGLDALAGFRSDGARTALVEVARKGSGTRRLHVLYALEKQKGPEADALLAEVAKSGDGPAVAQAALALGNPERQGVVPSLLPLLKDGDWQVRAAAARSLARHGAKEAIPALAVALDLAKGRDRTDIVAALRALSGQDLGWDPAPWKQLAAGADPASIRKVPFEVPTIFGIPITGQRVVICLDNSLRMSEAHPFGKERLEALCTPDDGKPILWYRIVTNGQFAIAHLKHLADGLPRGSKFEVLAFNATVNPLLGKLTPAGAAAKKMLEEALDGLQTDDGIATYTVLIDALNAGGAADGQAWRSGPDEIVFVTVNQPTAGEITEGDVVAAAISLKARLRMVPIHTVGIHFHPYDMCRAIAERTGGVYMDLTK